MEHFQIEGLILNKDDYPVSDVVVAIVQGSSPFPDIAAVSNEEGKFHFDYIQKGRYTLNAFYGMDRIQADVEVNEPNTKLIIRL